MAGNLASYSYAYDLNHATGTYNRLGQRVSMTATVPAQGLNNHLTKYEYDNLYQLTKTTYPNVAPFNGEVHTWTYDGIGNRLTNTVNASTKTYSYLKIGANPLNWQRLLSDGVDTYSYAYPSANPISKAGPSGTFNFIWNPFDGIERITGTLTANYLYDYQGRRTTRTVSGVTNSYLYDGLNLIRELGATPADYLFGPGIDEPLAMSRGGQTYYYSTDALGSVNLVTNSGGTVQNKYLHDAWGVLRSQTGTLGNPFGYTAREFGEAGTLFYRARYYSPGTGRFLSEDPTGYAAGPSLYAYVLNSPIRLIDPMGLHDTPGGAGSARTSGCCYGGTDHSTDVNRAFKGFCAEARSSSGGCRAILTKYSLTPCVDRKCQEGVTVQCVPKEGSCGGCGGPCNNLSDPTRRLFLQPNAFTPACGPLQDTVAHEMSHMCGVGRDNCADAQCRENRLRANNVGAACSGRPGPTPGVGPR